VSFFGMRALQNPLADVVSVSAPEPMSSGSLDAEFTDLLSEVTAQVRADAATTPEAQALLELAVKKATEALGDEKTYKLKQTIDKLRRAGEHVAKQIATIEDAIEDSTKREKERKALQNAALNMLEKFKTEQLKRAPLRRAVEKLDKEESVHAKILRAASAFASGEADIDYDFDEDDPRLEAKRASRLTDALVSGSGFGRSRSGRGRSLFQTTPAININLLTDKPASKRTASRAGSKRSKRSGSRPGTNRSASGRFKRSVY
jgi:uncharacterized phage infection (PIP) family protein YhgE